MNEQEKQALIASIKASIKDTFKEHGLEGIEGFQKLMGRLTVLEQHIAERGQGGPALHGNSMMNPFAAESFLQRLKAVQDGANSSGRIELKGLSMKGLKSIISLPDGGSPSSGWQTQAERGPTVLPAVRPLTLLDLLPVINVSSNIYEFIQVSHVNGAAVQENEGDQKAEGDITSTLVQTRIATVAEWFHASQQVLRDNAQLTTFLSTLLAYDVRQKAEDLIVTGDATDPEGFDGLLTAATSLLTTESLTPDILSEGITLMQSAGYVPNLIALHPQDFHRLRTLKASGGSEEYMVGSWAAQAPSNAWNVPIVASPAVTEFRGLIVDTTKVAVLDRQNVTVAISTEDRDNFIKNMVTLLGEGRLGLAIFDTGGVGKVELPTS